jgi:hypothetical protein
MMDLLKNVNFKTLGILFIGQNLIIQIVLLLMKIKMVSPSFIYPTWVKATD